jgi:hypothetical protein
MSFGFILKAENLNYFNAKLSKALIADSVFQRGFI